MSEIARLRKRLSNVQRNVVEYRMTVTEAKNLLKEIEDIQQEQLEKPQQVVVNEPAVINRTIDGGAF
jgi:hypothetical protein